MSETHDLGRLFVHSIRLRDHAPLMHWAHSEEVEEPFRTSRSLVVRLWPTSKALVLGWWRDIDRTEDEALLTALQACLLDLDFDSDIVENPEVRESIRRGVAKEAVDLDEEWQILDMLGVLD